MKKLAWILLISSACRSETVPKEGPIDSIDSTTEDSGYGEVIPPEDTAEAVEPPPPSSPVGAWSDCSGTLTLMEDSFTWQDNAGLCTISAPTTFSDGLITMPADDLSRCSQVPWWLSVFDGVEPEFGLAVSGTRLTLVPMTPLPAGRVAQFEENVEAEQWVLTAEEGVSSLFRLCWVDDVFFGGGYRSTNEGCDFLSCNGQVSAYTMSDRGESWTTMCGGACPCAGVVSISSRSDEALEGSFFGTNCARIFEGTFTGVPASR